MCECSTDHRKGPKGIHFQPFGPEPMKRILHQAAREDCSRVTGKPSVTPLREELATVRELTIHGLATTVGKGPPQPFHRSEAVARQPPAADNDLRSEDKDRQQQA